ncbi:hypothetical protein F443_00783 [Phytophthora nicotianae P1569]|uniref:Chromo domain-containing protein n=1 Tax=Phytophthora nicotianae P1569 TaxID=1317065 RepID=V9G0G3_PHYNI|nr:hypothetical protein F443_00783 [Phytophthora nicotianae P1569]
MLPSSSAWTVASFELVAQILNRQEPVVIAMTERRHTNFIWEGHEDLTWEPTDNLPLDLMAGFEASHKDSVWDYQSTRGMRRQLRAELPTRRSTRVRARSSLRRQLG